MVANCELLAKEANAIFYSANLVLKALEMETVWEGKERRNRGYEKRHIEIVWQGNVCYTPFMGKP